MHTSETSNMTDTDPVIILKDLRNTFASGKTKSLEFRIQQLKALKSLVDENAERIVEALHADLHKGPVGAIEGMSVSKEIDEVLKHIEEWMEPKKVETSTGDSAFIFYEPFGVALILGAWNYPFVLTLKPLVGAIAAGNCVVIKPSELAPASAQFMADYIPKYLDHDAYRVFLGGAEETGELLQERFDYIFYTGSTAVGRIIHASAAKYLTPITLELGGKSPVYLDSSVDIDKAAKKIVMAKTTNCGQICVAPDYLLCSSSVQDQFIESFKKAVDETFEGNAKASPLYARIVNDRHFQRVVNLLKPSNIAFGGENDASERYIAPTVVVNVKSSDPIMQEEIFGPILPIVNVEDVDEAINFITSREKPLALYIFSEDEAIIKKVLSSTSSGGVCVNDCIRQLMVQDLPFGGVGNSGMGRYGGKYSFDTFSHMKSVLQTHL